MKIATLLLGSLFCAGCVDPMVQQQQNFAAQEEARANYLLALQDRCSTYGYTRGTTEYANCMMQVDANTQAANQAADQQRRAAILGVLMSRPAVSTPQATFTPIQPRPTINTDCWTMSNGFISCTSR